jgi:hypothetical protein
MKAPLLRHSLSFARVSELEGRQGHALKHEASS